MHATFGELKDPIFLEVIGFPPAALHGSKLEVIRRWIFFIFLFWGVGGQQYTIIG